MADATHAPARRWKLSDDARELFFAKRAEWDARAVELGQNAEGGALSKADTQTLRAALVLAEMEQPGAVGAQISADVLDRAARYVEYSAACWADMPDGDPMALTYKDKELNPRVDGMRAWLRGRGRVSERDLRRNHVAGARKASDQQEMFKAYRETYPGNFDPSTKEYWA